MNTTKTGTKAKKAGRITRKAIHGMAVKPRKRPSTSATSEVDYIAVGGIGGAMVGATLAGPGGAIVGGLIGVVISAVANSTAR